MFITPEQEREERCIRKANLAVGHTVLCREVTNHVLRLIYCDGAVRVIQPNGEFAWEGTRRR